MNRTTKATAACKFCGREVNLDDEGVQYPDNTAAHEECADSRAYAEANAADFE